VWGDLPQSLPVAREYWLVFRYDEQAVPDLLAVPQLTRTIAGLVGEARRRGLNPAGVQLDIDSPTGSLARYAAFLGEVRKGLAPGMQLSITALLDWFRPGTEIAKVIDAVDEFVPQFYDVGAPDSDVAGRPIAAGIDAAHWGPEFNRFGKRFRVGISCFGRARMSRGGEHPRAQYFRDLAPADFGGNPAFQLETGQNQSGELVLTYRTKREVTIGYRSFGPEDKLEFVLSTPRNIGASVENARKMGGRVAGVLFFRWAEEREALVMEPGEVLDAARGQSGPKRPRIAAVDGECAAVSCVDLYLADANPLAAVPTHCNIRSSVELEYFLPEASRTVRMAGPARLTLTIPPYCGRGRYYLGHAVTQGPATFTVEEERP
jgi:hypothetical protein